MCWRKERSTTQTDINGTFKLEVTDLNAVLVFSFIGAREQEVPLNGKTQIFVKLKLDCTKDFFDANQIHLYARSGVINNPIGGQVHIASPWTRVGVINGAYSYQTDLGENKMLTAQVQLMHSISNCDFDIDFRWGHRQVAFDGNVNFKVNSIETDLNLGNLKLIAGYSDLDFTRKEQNERHNGLVVGAGTFLYMPLYPTAIVKFGVYGNKLAYEASIQGGHRRFSCFLKFYKLDSFNELSLGIGAAFWYRTNRRKG